jgi:hypothetical protein
MPVSSTNCGRDAATMEGERTTTIGEPFAEMVESLLRGIDLMPV